MAESAQLDRDTPAFLTGDGELARLIAAFNWAATSLGSISTWPQSLKSTVSLILRSHVPMVTLWGHDGVMIYNDAYSEFAGGRHPQLLGSRVREGWLEIAEFNDNVMKVGLAGGTLAYKDQELTLHRNGRPEPVWMDLDYSPILNEAGKPAGVIAIVIETTQKVLAERWSMSEQERMVRLFEQAPGFMAMLSGPEHRIVLTNPGYQRLIGYRDVLGKTVAETLHDAVEQGYLDLLDTVYGTGEAFTAEAAAYAVQAEPGGPVDERFVDFVFQPLRDADGQVVGIFVQGSDVTDRVGAETQLQRAQEAGGVGLFTLDLATRMLLATPEFCRVYGLPEAEAFPVSAVEDLVVADDAQVVLDAPARAAGLAPVDVEYRIRRADTGALRTIARKGRYEHDIDDRPARLVGAVQDVTERRKVQAALEESEAQFRALAEAIPNQAWTARPDGQLDWFNAQVYRYSGAAAGDLHGEGWGRIVHPEDLPQAAAAWEHSLKSGEPYVTEFRLRAADGAYRWHLARAIAIRSGEQIVRWVGSNTDIEDQKQAEVATARDRDRLWTMSQDLMLVCDYAGVITAVNPSAERLLGWSEDEMLGHNLSEFVHPDDVESTAAEVGKLSHGVTTMAFENRYRSKDGGYRLLDWTAVPDAGRVHAVGRDITDQRAIVRDQERIWSLSPVLKVVGDATGRILKVNPAWTTTLGWSLEQTVGQSLLHFLAPQARGEGEAMLASLANTDIVADQQLAFIDSTEGQHQVVWTIVRENDTIYGFGRDVTEQRTAEDALRQSQKMEAVGQLTGGIAHDFNNLLQGITGSLDLVQKRISQGRLSELDRFITGAMTSANRASALTHRLLAFSRRQPLDPRPVRANPLVASMEDLLRRTLGERIELELVLSGGLWRTRCDPNQLESAILNLAINARDAMPDGGKLVIETCNAHLDTVYAARQRDVRPGQYVCICVTDTGMGMTAETIARAFEPFFTTKPIGQGTGLGLSMIYGFAQQSEGYAKIYSEVGKGTTFKLYLPRHRGEAEDEEALPQLTDAHVSDAGETVLVVEDESVVRGLIVEVLSDLGYNAIEAADGPQGLEVLQSKRRIDLLVTDIGLPGLNGRQIADAGRALRPELKVLFMTGYAENAALASGFLEPGMAMITKPFAMEALATRVREIIEAG
jgi:PAS domain S-box-containing protein